MQTVVITAITTIVYVFIDLLKLVCGDKVDKISRYFPLMAGVIGIVGGIVAYATGLTDVGIETAILTGAASGLAATGVNQIGKQFRKDDSEYGDED